LKREHQKRKTTMNEPKTNLIKPEKIIKDLTIRLLVTDADASSTFSTGLGNDIQLELTEEDYQKYEQKTKNLGINTNEALANGILTLIKHGFSTEEIKLI
jgi:hypothetical protein